MRSRLFDYSSRLTYCFFFANFPMSSVKKFLTISMMCLNGKQEALVKTGIIRITALMKEVRGRREIL